MLLMAPAGSQRSQRAWTDPLFRHGRMKLDGFSLDVWRLDGREARCCSWRQQVLRGPRGPGRVLTAILAA